MNFLQNLIQNWPTEILDVDYIKIPEDVEVPSVLRWKVVQTVIGIIQISVPVAVIMNIETLKTYSISFAKNRLDDAFSFNIYIIPPSLCFAMYVILYFVYSIIGI